MAQAYNNISFYALYDAPKTAALDDILILNDNFDSPVHLEQPINRGSVPSKMVSIITVLVCLDGHIEGSNNLRSFRLEKNDVVVNRSGTIGHFYGMSKDVKFLLLIVNTNFYFPTMISGALSSLRQRHSSRATATPSLKSATCCTSAASRSSRNTSAMPPA